MRFALALSAAWLGAAWLAPAASAQSLVRLEAANDTFAGLDRWLSSRLQLSVTGQAWSGERTALHVHGGVGQLMYTSRNIQRTEAPTRDHAFAGWLYADLGVVAVHRSHLFALRTRLGVVGPAAGAEPVQDATHRLLGVRRPQGWHNQLPNQFAYRVRGTYVFQPDLRLDGLSLQPGAAVELDLGNAHGRARGSLGVVLAHNMRGAGAFDRNLVSVARCPDRCLAVFGVAFAEGVWRNLFVEAEGAATPPDIEIRPWVVGAETGLFYQRRRFWTGFRYVMQTRTFDNTPRRRLHPRVHRYVSVEFGALIGAL